MTIYIVCVLLFVLVVFEGRKDEKEACRHIVLSAVAGLLRRRWMRED